MVWYGINDIKVDISEPSFYKQIWLFDVADGDKSGKSWQQKWINLVDVKK